MFEENVDFGAGGAMPSAYSLTDEQRLLADIDQQIGRAGGPSMAMMLMNQKQALADRIRFKQWLSQTQSLDHISSEPVVVTARLSRRVQHAINSF